MFEHPLSPNACLVAGMVTIAASVFYLFMLTFHPGKLGRTHRFRHSDNKEKGPPVSRVSGFAMVIFIGYFGYIMIGDGYLHTTNRNTAVHILVSLFFLLIVTVVYDSIRTRMRRRKRRTVVDNP